MQLVEETVIDDVALLEATIVDLEKRISDTKERIATSPRYVSLLDVLCDLEQRKQEIVKQIETATVRTPTKQLLHETQGLVTSVVNDEVRQRIRQRVRELVTEIWLLIEAKGKGLRTCHCQVFFKNGDVREFWLTTRRKGCEWSFKNNERPLYDLRKYSPKTYNQLYPKTSYGLRFSSISLN